MMKKSIVLLLLVMSMLPLNAQIRGSEITVMVTPDHQDWTYRVGETCRFTVSVLRSGTLIDNALVDFEAGPEMYPEVKKTGVVLKDGTMKHQGTMKVPGFYRLSVTAHVNGKDYKGACGAAFSPEQLQPSTVMPADFQSFWQGAIAEARKTDLNPTKRLLPERCTKDVNVYEVSFNNILRKRGGILPCCGFPGQVCDPMAAMYIQLRKEPSPWRSVFTGFL